MGSEECYNRGGAWNGTFLSILTVKEHTKHTLQSFLWCSLFMLEVTTPPWPIQPPSQASSLGETLQYDTTFEKLG